MRQLTNTVWLVSGERTGRYPDANGLLIAGQRQTMLLDAPLCVLHEFADILGTTVPMPDVSVLSHCHEDHLPGLALPSLRRLPVWVHQQDAYGLRSLEGLLDLYGMPEPTRTQWRIDLVEQFHFVPRPDALEFEDGHCWDLGGVTVTAVHAPGHTAGHCLFRVKEHGPQAQVVLFLGDIDLSGFGPYYGDAGSSLIDFERSLDRLVGARADWFVTGHHIGSVDQVTFDLRLPKYRNRIRQREERLLAFLESPRTLQEMIEHRIVYRPTDQVDGAEWIERRSIGLHVERLEAAGVIRPVEQSIRSASPDGETRWKRVAA